jgi:hypothetical protein
MPITEVNELFASRSSDIDLQWRRTYRRAWQVITNDPYVGALAVRTAIPVGVGDQYRTYAADGTTQLEYDTLAYVNKITAQVDAPDGCSWTVTADYGPYDPTQFPENPLDHPIKISFGGTKFQRPIDETPADASGNSEAILNSAGDYFDPPVEVDDNRPTIRIIRNEQYFNAGYALTFKDVTNTADWNGFPAGTVKMALPLGDLEFSPVCGFYFVVTYEFEIKPEGWKLKILDRGLKVLDPDTGEQLVIVDPDGKPVTSPSLLDGAGNELSPDADPFFMEYDGYLSQDFSALSLAFDGAPGMGTGAQRRAYFAKLRGLPG